MEKDRGKREGEVLMKFLVSGVVAVVVVVVVVLLLLLLCTSSRAKSRMVA